MSTGSFPRDTDPRATSTFPVVQRTGIRLFRRMARWATANMRDIGYRAYFLRDIGRALADPATYVPETIRQMRNIGVDSIPLACIVAAFIVYLGDQLGVGGQLSTGVVVVLGVRIFGNVAAIRRHLFRA